MSEEKEFTLKNYFDFIKEEILMGSKCKKCGKIFLPPMKFCNGCYASDMKWIEFSGKGILDTYSLIHVGARYFSNQGYKMGKPYCFATVKLEEGARISGHMVGPNVEFEGNSDNFTIGMKVKFKPLEVNIEGEKEPKIDLGFEPA